MRLGISGIHHKHILEADGIKIVKEVVSTIKWNFKTRLRATKQLLLIYNVEISD